MAGIIGIITAIAVAVYWLSRAAREARDVAGEIRNLPRKRRFEKNASRETLDLITDPREAGVVLLMALARMGKSGRIEETAGGRIESLMRRRMNYSAGEAEDLMTNLRWATRDLKQPGTVLYPMCNVLQAGGTLATFQDLSAMMDEVADIDGKATQAQTEFIRTVRERLGLV